MSEKIGTQVVVMVGNWHFPPHVTEAELVALAQEFADSPDGAQYLDLHVRGVPYGEEKIDAFILGFKYQLQLDANDRGAAHKRQFHKMRQTFKDRFGKGINWSVSSPATIIKQVGL